MDHGLSNWQLQHEVCRNLTKFKSMLKIAKQREPETNVTTTVTESRTVLYAARNQNIVVINCNG